MWRFFAWAGVFAVFGSIIEYRLGYNFGNVVYDFSGNGFHGKYVDIELHLSTDRGLFFAKSTSWVTASAFKSFQIIPDTSFMVFWAFFIEIDGMLAFFTSSSNDNFFILIPLEGYICVGLSKGDSSFTDTVNSDEAIIDLSKKHIDKWTLILYSKVGDLYDIRVNENHYYKTTPGFTQPLYNDLKIGSNGIIDSVSGFLWFFSITTNSNLNDFWLDSSSSNCLTLPSASCTPCSQTVNDPGLSQGCLSTESSISKDSASQDCPSQPCSSGLTLDCSSCASNSCLISLKSLQVFCLLVSYPVAVCVSPYHLINGKCCFQECSDCDSKSPYKCKSCISNKAAPDLLFGCSCNEWYEGVHPLSAADSCLYSRPCGQTCFSCNGVACKDCISVNASPALDGSCSCVQGFYPSKALTENDACLPCHITCLNCSSSNACIQCKAINSTPNNEKCQCMKGFYQASSLENPDACHQCHHHCNTCLDSLKCQDCLALNAIPTELEGCECEKGFWMQKELNSKNACLKCPDYCLECENQETCSKCFDFFSVFDEFSKKCVCITGFFFDIQTSSCKKCHVDCRTCLSYPKCLECLNSSYLLNEKSGICEILCEKNEVLVNGTCFKCPGLCLTCSNLEKCTQCVENAEINQKICVCVSGYFNSRGTCERRVFDFSVKLIASQRFSVKFEEPVNVTLIKSDFSIQFKKKPDFSFSVIKNRPNVYIFYLEFKENIKNNTEATLVINYSPLFSVNNSLLRYYKKRFKVQEFQYFDHFVVVEWFSNNAQVISKIFVTISASSLFISNPSGFWAIINMLDLISYLPMADNNLSDKLVTICTSTADFNFFPNLATYVFSSQSSSDVTKRVKKLGINTSVFWVNIGQNMSLFFIILANFPVFLLLSWLTSETVAEKFKKYLRNYRYSIIIRYWIQSYLDYLFFSMIQIESDVKIQSEGYFNLASAYFFMVRNNQVMIFSTPLTLFVFTFLSHKKIKNNDEVFIRRFGSFFEEFKNDRGSLSSLFYFVFFMRRLLYFLSQTFLNANPIIQASLNVSGSLFVLAYLVFYRPFKETSLFLCNLIGEICILACFTLTLLINIQFFYRYLKVLEIIFVLFVMFGMIFQLGVNVFQNFKGFQSMWKKIEKSRAQAFLKAFKAKTEENGSSS